MWDFCPCAGGKDSDPHLHMSIIYVLYCKWVSVESVACHVRLGEVAWLDSHIERGNWEKGAELSLLTLTQASTISTAAWSMRAL